MPPEGTSCMPRIWAVLALVLVVALLARADDVPAEKETKRKPDPAAAAAQVHKQVVDYENRPVSPLATTGPKPEPITPPARAEIDAAIRRGVRFLLADQRPDGAWGSPEKTKAYNIYAPPPGAHEAFRVATTSLGLMTLVEAEPKLPAKERPPVAASIDRGEKWLTEHLPSLRRANLDAVYNVWGHAYAIQALVRLYHRAAGNAELQKKYVDLARHQADMLQKNAFGSGGWAYYDFLIGEYDDLRFDASFSFCTATGLIALDEAKSIGVEFPQVLIDKAITALHRQQKPDFSYAYGEYLDDVPMMDINRPASSLGRSQACNLALRLWGDKHVTDEVMETWLDRLYARNGWLSIARKKPIAHESFFSVSGYFYYYGHWHAALCIDQLPAERRKHFQDYLAHILLPLQEKDGSWWDYPFYNYHQQYGTSMAVMALLRCQPDWQPPTFSQPQ